MRELSNMRSTTLTQEEAREQLKALIKHRGARRHAYPSPLPIVYTLRLTHVHRPEWPFAPDDEAPFHNYCEICGNLYKTKCAVRQLDGIYRCGRCSTRRRKIIGE